MLNFRSLKYLLFSLFLICTNSSWASHSGSLALGGLASPINTESAVPLTKGHWSVGIRTEYVKTDQISKSRLRRLREQDDDADLHSVDNLFSTSLGVAYGVTENLTVGIRVPYIRRHEIREAEHGHDDGDEEEETEHGHEDGVPDIHDDGGDDSEEELEVALEDLGDSKGIGDTVVFGQYRLYQNADSTKHAAALFGVKTPTGRTTERSPEGERFETENQPGSGSWDGLLGAAYTQNFGALSFDSNVLYTIVTEGAQATDLGDIFSYNLALSYRLGGGERGSLYNPERKGVSWDLIMELNGEWRQKEEIGGEKNANSGFHSLYFSPGARVGFGSRVNIGLSIGVPIVSDYNGDQDNLGYRVISSFNFNY